MELCSVREGKLRGLLGHRPADFYDAVADVDYRGLAGGIEIAPAGVIDDPAAIASDCERVRFPKISGEEGGVGRHDDKQIVAEGELTLGKY
jgi:hypothetical protein